MVPKKVFFSVLIIPNILHDRFHSAGDAQSDDFLHNCHFGRKWFSRVDRAIYWETLDLGFIFSFVSILASPDFSFLIYNNDSKVLPLIEW